MEENRKRGTGKNERACCEHGQGSSCRGLSARFRGKVRIG